MERCVCDVKESNLHRIMKLGVKDWKQNNFTDDGEI